MRPTVDLVVTNGTLVDVFGEYPNTSVAIDRGRFVAVGSADIMPPAQRTIDATGCYLLPGVIDAHVHFREPGLAYKEGYPAGSAAAALGGVTCVFDMPNTEPPTNTAQRVREKIDLVQGRSWVDYAFYGLLSQGDSRHLAAMAAAGVIGIKTFLGQSETGLGCPLPPNDGELLDAMQILAGLGVRLAVHAENHQIMQHRIADLKLNNVEGLAAHRDSRPSLVEAEAIARIGIFAEHTRCPVHIVHVSSQAGLEQVRRARQHGVDISAETCPHYLLFPNGTDASERVRLRVNPPIRGESDRDALIQALRSDGLQFVASDHAPHADTEKCGGSIWQVRAGLIGVQHLLQLLWSHRTELGLTLSQIVRLTSFGPARTWRVWPGKGSITPDADGDLVIVDPDREWTIAAASIQSLHPQSPYLGWQGKGMPIWTVVRGNIVAEEGKLVGSPCGRWLPGPHALQPIDNQ
ncbi:MAG TPA: dihydroorotase [Thermoanaerobaculia bacterium]|nr:dihydroorotase [Thermoanaerobaculia bacterium]